MIFCIECFKDTEIRAIISSKDIGDCGICGKTNVKVYDTEKYTEVQEVFNELVDIYSLERELGEDFPEEKLGLLKDDLYNNWNIFNVELENSYKILKEICKERFTDDREFFRSAVGIKEIVSEEYLENNCILRKQNWDSFEKEIKTMCRFHGKNFNGEVFAKYLPLLKSEYKEGKIFYRARISGEEGFEKDEMGAPPMGKASGGRVNPEGISYLYLASKRETAIREIRASALDYVTVAKFKLVRDIKVVDFNRIGEISPFAVRNILDLRINYESLKKIGDQVAKPFSKETKSLEYLPIQYLADYIKSLEEWDGIAYTSTLGEGENIALFTSELVECIDSNVTKIKKVEYSY